jgi:hypothetical protein
MYTVLTVPSAQPKWHRDVISDRAYFGTHIRTVQGDRLFYMTIELPSGHYACVRTWPRSYERISRN